MLNYIHTYLGVDLLHKIPSEKRPSIGPPVAPDTVFIMRTRLPSLGASIPRHTEMTPNITAEKMKIQNSSFNEYS